MAPLGRNPASDGRRGRRGQLSRRARSDELAASRAAQRDAHAFRLKISRLSSGLTPNFVYVHRRHGLLYRQAVDRELAVNACIRRS